MTFHHEWEVAPLSKNLNYGLRLLLSLDGVEADRGRSHPAVVLDALGEMLRTGFPYVEYLAGRYSPSRLHTRVYAAASPNTRRWFGAYSVSQCSVSRERHNKVIGASFSVGPDNGYYFFISKINPHNQGFCVELRGAPYGGL